jgi:hypothetical protein
LSRTLPRMGWVKCGGYDLHVPAPVQLAQSRYSQRRLLTLHWLQSLKVLASPLAQAPNITNAGTVVYPLDTFRPTTATLVRKGSSHAHRSKRSTCKSNCTSFEVSARHTSTTPPIMGLGPHTDTATRHSL